MAKNDLILLDQIVSDAASAQSIDYSSSYFESFALHQLLKDRELTSDEVQICMMDGRNDGGIDAWLLFIDGDLVLDTADVSAKKNASSIELVIFTCKHHETFRLEPLISLHTAITELFDLSIKEDSLTQNYHAGLINARAAFKHALVKTAQANPKVSFEFYYISRGDSNNVGNALQSRATTLENTVHSLFSDCTVSMSFCGATEILLAYRKLPDFSSVVKFSEGPISRGNNNFLGLATLKDYVKFISDEEGNLRRYLFESNVRDYMGRNYVNDSIERTLASQENATDQDFWWLNNGVTILASQARPIGKELHLENVQIVNGLQTTESIFRHFSIIERSDNTDERCILVRILVTTDKDMSDAIILATNNQTKVDQASLRATDKIQRDIEDLLLSHDWYYDRRKNYYLNTGKPSKKIVSINYMAWATLAVRLRMPEKCGRSRPRYMHSDQEYQKIFDSRAHLPVFLAVLKICKEVEQGMREQALVADNYAINNYAGTFRFLYASVYVARVTRKYYCNDEELISLAKEPFNEIMLSEAHDIILELRQRHPGKRLHRNSDFCQSALAAALE